MYPFERFSEQAKRALTTAQGEAERSHRSYIGTEHLLLGLFQVEGALAPKILAALGLEIATVRRTIEQIVTADERVLVQQIIPTSRVKRVIEIAFEESRSRGEGYVGTEHLLLGLVIEGEGIAGRVLTDLGATVGRVREAIDRLRTAGGEEDAPAPGGRPPHATGRPMGMPSDPRRMAAGFEDLFAVELLAALLDRFGASGPPPPRLLELAGELRRVRRQKHEAVDADDYEAAKRHHEVEQRLQAEVAAELEAWRGDR